MMISLQRSEIAYDLRTVYNLISATDGNSCGLDVRARLDLGGVRYIRWITPG